MNQEEIGKFIRELRKEKNMSQTDLAEKLYLSRNAISRWENGHNLPDAHTFTLLAELFDVSTDELLLGKRINKEKRENEVSALALTMVDHGHKQNKMIRLLIIVLVTLLLMFFGYYFINSYNSIKVYIMSGESENFYTKDGIFVVTNDNMYFRLGNLEFNDDITVEEATLFYKKGDEEILIFSSDDYDIFLRDYNGYEMYFKNNNMKDIMNNLYLRIKYNDTFEDVKINLEKDFINNSLIFRKRKKGSLENNKEAKNFDNENSIIQFSKDKMICEDENCALEIVNEDVTLIFSFFEEEKMLNVFETNKNISKEWIYYMNEEMLEYKVYEEGKEDVIVSVYLNKENDYDDIEYELINDFQENYILKYLY